MKNSNQEAQSFSFKRKILSAAVLAALHAPTVQAACVITGTTTVEHCASDYVQVYAEPGSASLVVDNMTTASVELRPSIGATGPFDQTIRLTGNTIINNPSYSGVIMQSSLAGRNATVITASTVSITSGEGFGGIWVRNDTSGNIVINNAATVSASATTLGPGDGITASTNLGSVQLTNSGNVTSLTDRGLYGDGGYSNTGSDFVTVKIFNTGTVNAKLAGIRSINYYGLSAIENSGTVNSETRQGLVAWSNSGPASITNTGSVSSGDDNALHAMTEIGDITVVNSGTLRAADDPGVVAVRTGYSGIRAEVDMDPAATGSTGSISITNNASGNISAPDDYAVAAMTPSGNISIVNRGSLAGLGGIEATASAGNVSIDNGGRIVASGSSADAIAVVSATGGSITNSDVVSGARNAIRIDAGSLLDAGITNTSSGKLVGGLQIDSATNLVNNGLIALKTGADLNSILNTGAVAQGRVGGNFTQGSGGVLHLAANGLTAGTYSSLAVAGTADLSGTLDVDVKSGLNAAGTMAGVISSSALSNKIAQVTDNSLRYAFTAVNNGTNVDLVVTDTGITSVSQGVSPNPGSTVGAARVFDAAISSNNPAMQDVISGLNSSSGSADLTKRVSQTLPLLTGNTQAGAAATSSGINRVIQARQDANRGLSSGDEFYGDRNVWMKPFASRADQDDRGGVAGYKSNSYGIVAGLDGALSSALRLGAAFAYARSDINGRSSLSPQSADVNVYQLIAYGSYALDARSEINFQADIGQNDNTGRRGITFMATEARASYTSQTAHLGSGLGRTYPLNSRTSLIPSVRFDYTWIKDKAYTESGAGALNLSVNARTTEAMVIGFDGKLAHQLNDQTTLLANLGLGYDTLNQRTSITSAFAGAPGAAFVTYGIDPSPWITQAGIGAVYKTKSQMEITGRYDLEHRNSFLNQTASVKLRWLF